MNMVGTLVDVLIFTSLIGVIVSQVVTAKADGNLTASEVILIGLITTFVIVGFIAYIVKKAGLKGK